MIQEIEGLTGAIWAAPHDDDYEQHRTKWYTIAELAQWPTMVAVMVNHSVRTEIDKAGIAMGLSEVPKAQRIQVLDLENRNDQLYSLYIFDDHEVASLFKLRWS